MDRAFGIFLIIVMTVFGPVSRAGVSLQSGISGAVLSSPSLTGAALSGLTAQRCFDFVARMGLQTSPEAKRSCPSLLTDFSKLLDLAVVKREETGQFYPVVFQKRLLEILHDPRLPLLTGQLGQELSMALAYEYRFSLFDLVRRFTRSDEEALEWIAVLFQDVTPLQLHLRWAFSKARSTGEKDVVTRFASQLEELWRIVHLDKERADRVELYPAGSAPTLGAAKNAKLYHYYVPLWLTRSALKRGYSRELAVYLGYHFNFLYEALGQGADFAILWRDPSALRAQESARDSYLGLRGALFNLNPVFNPLPFEEFESRVTKDVPGSHTTLLAILGWYFRWSKDF